MVTPPRALWATAVSQLLCPTPPQSLNPSLLRWGGGGNQLSSVVTTVNNTVLYTQESC